MEIWLFEVSFFESSKIKFPSILALQIDILLSLIKLPFKIVRFFAINCELLWQF